MVSLGSGFKLHGSKVQQLYFPTRQFICGFQGWIVFICNPMDTFIMIHCQLNLNHRPKYFFFFISLRVCHCQVSSCFSRCSHDGLLASLLGPISEKRAVILQTSSCIHFSCYIILEGLTSQSVAGVHFQQASRACRHFS